MLKVLLDFHQRDSGRALVKRRAARINFDDWTNSTLQPNSLLPSEFLSTYRRRVRIEPEKRLMLAILEDVVRCVQKYGFSEKAKGQKLFQEALEWIAEEDSDWPFSIEALCETLGINPSYLRRKLLCWREPQREAVDKPMMFLISRRRVPHGQRRAVSKPPRGGHRRLKVVS